MTALEGNAGSVAALSLSGLKGIWQSKLVWLALGFSAVHIGIRVGIVVFVSLFVPPAVPDILDPGFLAGMITLQATLPVVIILGTVGARVTARDRMMGGLEFLLSKALPPWGYVLGRALTPLAAAAALIFLPTVLTALLLWGMIDPLPPGTGDLLWGAVGMSAVVTLAIGPLAAGLGTLVDNPRSATGLWLVLVWATLPLSAFLNGVGVDWWWTISPIIVSTEIGETLVGRGFPGAHEWMGWAEVTGLVLAPLALLWYRTREVYR